MHRTTRDVMTVNFAQKYVSKQKRHERDYDVLSSTVLYGVRYITPKQMLIFDGVHKRFFIMSALFSN